MHVNVLCCLLYRVCRTVAMPSHADIIQTAAAVSGYLNKVANRALSVVVAAGSTAEGVSFNEGALKLARQGAFPAI